MKDHADLKGAAERLITLKASDCASAGEHIEMFALCNMAFRKQAGPTRVLALITEIERLKKFEDWFTRLDSISASLEESTRDQRDLALFSVLWAARLFMVPSDIDDEEFREHTIKRGAATLMVGGKRLYDTAERDWKGKPVIPFDWQYRSARETAQ